MIGSVSRFGEKIYHSTSVGEITIPWEIEFDARNKAIYLFDESALVEEMANGYSLEFAEIFKVGESLISFFELDLEKYNRKLEEFISGCRAYNCALQKIHLFDLEHFIHTLEFKHPYFFSLDTEQLSEMNWEEAYQALKIDLKKVSTLYDLICGLCGNKYTPSFAKDKHESARYKYLDSIDGIMHDLFCRTNSLQQRMHYNIYVNPDEQSIHDFELKYRYYNISPFSFCITEFYKMLEWDISIRRCKNCNKLFIPDSNHAVDYCNRVDSETGYTCKKVGAAAQYKTKVNSHPILREYAKAYKRNYARIGKAGMSNEDFRVWADEAAKKRDEFLEIYDLNPSENVISEFKKYLGNK